MLVDGQRAGWVRVDGGEVSAAVVPAYRGQRLAARWIAAVSTRGCYARIKPGNLASVKAFLGAGYRWVDGDRYEYAG